MDLIPLIDAPRQTLTIVLGGQSLHLTAWWQPLSSRWYLSVADLVDAPIALGRQIAPAGAAGALHGLCRRNRRHTAPCGGSGRHRTAGLAEYPRSDLFHRRRDGAGDVAMTVVSCQCKCECEAEVNDSHSGICWWWPPSHPLPA